MAKDKKTILVYADWISIFEKLEDAEAGKLIKHFFNYVNDQNPSAPDRLTDIIFEPMKQQLKRDLKKYEAICLKNKENINIRWNKRNTTVYDRIRPDTKHTDTDTDTDIKEEIYKEEKTHVERKIVYSKFYDAEIAKAGEDKNYQKIVKILFGENNLGIPLKSVLKMEEQLSFVQFQKIWYLKEKYKFSITEVLEEMENWKDLTKRKTVYKTFGTFIKRRNPNIEFK